MITIKGISNERCFLTGRREDVVEVKSKQFSGHVCWPELLKIVKRLSQGSDSPVMTKKEQ